MDLGGWDPSDYVMSSKDEQPLGVGTAYETGSTLAITGRAHGAALAQVHSPLCFTRRGLALCCVHAETGQHQQYHNGARAFEVPTPFACTLPVLPQAGAARPERCLGRPGQELQPGALRDAAAGELGDRRLWEPGPCAGWPSVLYCAMNTCAASRPAVLVPGAGDRR